MSLEQQRTFSTILSIAADEAALLRPQDVSRVMGECPQVYREGFKDWLLEHADLMPRTRNVLTTGLYMGEKAF